MWDFLYKLLLDTGNNVVTTWIGVFIVWSAFLALSRIFTRVREVKIQKRKYRLQTLRHELLWSAFNVALTGFILVQFSSLLVDAGWLKTNAEPVSWYVMAFEFTLYFFIFDFYFYCIHRFFHLEPWYKWIHKIHHRSVSPNPLSSTSMTPIEGVAEGLIVPIFMTVFTIHDGTSLLIIPFATLMGLYVHCGYEFLPRWWYRSSLTNWFITPMFHDQHHQYYNYNYGAYTTIWDRVFGTVRPRFYEDFDRLKKQQVNLQEVSG